MIVRDLCEGTSVKRKENFPKLIPWLLVPVAFLLGYFLTSWPHLSVDESSFDELLANIRAGRVARVEILDKSITASLKPLKSGQESATLSIGRLPGIAETELIHELDAARVKFSGVPDTGGGWLATFLLFGLPLLLLASLYMASFRVTYGHSVGSSFLTRSTDERTYSVQTAHLMDEEIRRAMDHIYHRVHSILKVRVDELHVIAASLTQRETLTRVQIDELISPKSIGKERRAAPVETLA